MARDRGVRRQRPSSPEDRRRRAMAKTSSVVSRPPLRERSNTFANLLIASRTTAARVLSHCALCRSSKAQVRVSEGSPMNLARSAGSSISSAIAVLWTTVGFSPSASRRGKVRKEAVWTEPQWDKIRRRTHDRVGAALVPSRNNRERRRLPGASPASGRCRPATRGVRRRASSTLSIRSPPADAPQRSRHRCARRARRRSTLPRPSATQFPRPSGPR